MRLAENHIISKKHTLWQECDKICFASKNLYNQALYRVITHHKETKKYLSYNTLAREMAAEAQCDYVAMRAKVSQQTLMLLNRNMKSFFESLKKYKKNPSSFTGMPCLPRYLNKKKGRYEAVFTSQAVSRNGRLIRLSGTDIIIPTDKIVRQASVTPMENGDYKINIIYEFKEPYLIINDRYAGIDIGVNNLAAVVTNKEVTPFIINGRPLKAINQFYNKKLSKLKSELPFYVKENERVQRKSSKKIRRLTHKRNCKINDYLHKQSRKLADKLKQADISKVVIGQNKKWKTNVNIGSKNNQKFVLIPHAKFIQMCNYKLRLVGTKTILREESHTSKCSFLDHEEIKHHERYAGRRIRRGLFKTSTGFLWNADCNGAANILVKEIPNAFADGIEAVVVPPIRIKSYTKVA